MAKTALITGATAGIGEATAHALAEEGYNLILTGRRASRLRDLKRRLEREYKIEALALAFDIRDRAQCEASINALPAEFREIDVLVNNAGLASGLDFVHEGDPNDWDAMIDTNIKGLLYITRLVSARMVARGTGHIVNIGSIAGTQPYQKGAVYAGTKHAVHAISQSMRADLLGTGVKVTEIRPGMVETEFSIVRFHGDRERADEVYEGVTPLTANDVADTVCWALSRPAHVNIDEIMLTCTQQASVYYLHKNCSDNEKIHASSK